MNFIIQLLRKVKLLWAKLKIWAISSLEDEVIDIDHKNKQDRLNSVFAKEYIEWLQDYLDEKGFYLIVKHKTTSDDLRTFNRFNRINSFSHRGKYKNISNCMTSLWENIYIIRKELFVRDVESKFQIARSTDIIVIFKKKSDYLDEARIVLKDEYKNSFYIPDEFFDKLNTFFNHRVKTYKSKNTTDRVTGLADRYEIHNDLTEPTSMFKVELLTVDVISHFKNPFSAYTYETVKGDRFAEMASINKKKDRGLIGSIRV